MCGIAGVVGRPTSRAELDLMGGAIAHRGPDDATTWHVANAGFAFRRLSIIDVAGGAQPIVNEDGTLAIIMNGEIYNHHELRALLEGRGHRFRTHSDVETVLHLYEDEGNDCLQQLVGMFALAIWDRRRQVLLLARDRVGKKPMFIYRFADGSLAFASEIKALLQLGDVPRNPLPAAIDQFLALQYVPAPQTAFEGIERLPAAHWLTWQAGRVESNRYWRLDFSSKSSAGPDELAEELRTVLRRAVADRLESEVPLGAFLSGGVDSSAVVALMAEASAQRVKTFSIGFADERFDESRYAREIAAQFDTDHHELVVDAVSPDQLDRIVWHYDQPFGDPSAVPSFEVARITRPYVTVVLNGDGGDEAFAGYDRYQLSQYAWLLGLPGPVLTAGFMAAKPLTAITRRGRRFADVMPRDRWEAYLGSLSHLPRTHRSWLYTSEFAAAALPALVPWTDVRGRVYPSYLDGMLDMDINHYLPDDLLVKMDIASMAHSLEARSPFLDHRVLEFSARVPANLKIRDGGGKWLLKQALRGVVPDAVLSRPKMGFGAPIGRWMRTSLRPLLEDALSSSNTLARGYFQGSGIARMLNAHMDGDDRYAATLWDLLMLELWHRAFIDRTPSTRSTLA